MRTVFWLSAAIVIYVYVGYPIALAAWSRLSPRRRPERPPEPVELPGVSVVLAVRNEAARLPARIDNILAADYPNDRLELIVVSNGSSDGTEAALSRYAGRIITRSLGEVGKAGALNVAAAAASHEILVFADARQRFASDAIRRLVEPFADPQVGGVSGELVLDAERSSPGTASDGEDEHASPVGEGVGLYWRYEKWLRRHESHVHSVLGATGAIYALRRDLWRPLPEQTLLDDVLSPMRAVLAGRRIVFAPGARAFDQASPDAATEGRRKERTLAGNYQLLWLEPRLLVPGINPVWLQFVSHKLGRLVVPYALVALLVSSAALASSGAVYGLALAAQVVFYVLAAHGALVISEPSDTAGRAGAVRQPGRRAEAESDVMRKDLAHAQSD